MWQRIWNNSSWNYISLCIVSPGWQVQWKLRLHKNVRSSAHFWTWTREHSQIFLLNTMSKFPTTLSIKSKPHFYCSEEQELDFKQHFLSSYIRFQMDWNISECNGWGECALGKPKSGFLLEADEPPVMCDLYLKTAAALRHKPTISILGGNQSPTALQLF